MSAAVKCHRCQRRMRNITGWNVVLSKGVATGHLCPTCQTPEENAEAEINYATVDYGRDQFGRVIGKSKVQL